VDAKFTFVHFPVHSYFVLISKDLAIQPDQAMPIIKANNMASERQIIANRINGAKSRGPITPEGKLASSGNRTVHGLLSEAIIIEGECGDRFLELHDCLIAELQPETSTEYILVENMAVSRWRTMRVWVFEYAAVYHEIRKQAGAHEGESQPTRAALAYRTLSDETHWLDLFNRYEVRFDHQFARSMQRFYQQRARRKKAGYLAEEKNWEPEENR
jgi:hypothetical protein